MKDMKLIMESWKQFSENEIKEQLLREQFNAYLDENNIVLTEGELEEGLKSWAKKAATTAGVALALGAGAPAMAQATPTTGPETTQQVTSVSMQDADFQTQTLLMKLMAVDIFGADGKIDEEAWDKGKEIIKQINEIQDDADLNKEILMAWTERGPSKDKFEDLGEIAKRFKKPGQL